MKKTRIDNRHAPGTYAVGKSEYRVRRYFYDEKVFEGKDNLTAEQMLDFSETKEGQNCLVIVNDFFDESLLEQVRKFFRVHSLVLEDIVNTDQRSKYEKYDSYELCIVREPYGDRQISLLLTPEILLLFQEDDDETCTYHVIDRLKRSEGRIRGRDTGYLTYAFLDSVIDDYFAVGEILENEIEEMEKKIEEEKATFSDIAALKRKIVEYRKNAIPLREMVIRLNGSREESLFGRDVRNFPFLADLVDHCTRIVESADRLRDITFSLVDLHNGMTSSKMNQIMKVLTAITTIFVPVTFLTSVYGMNFEGMNEIHWKHGYLAFWTIVLGISGALFFYFKRKKWL